MKISNQLFRLHKIETQDCNKLCLLSDLQRRKFTEVVTESTDIVSESAIVTQPQRRKQKESPDTV